MQTEMYHGTDAHIDQLIHHLLAQGYEILGPVLREGVIDFAPIQSLADLPRGVVDTQEPGKYLARKTDSQALFSYSVGAKSAKNFLFPAEATLWKAKKDKRAFHVLPSDETPAKRAFLGIRSCDLAAIQIQDRVFMSKSSDDSKPNSFTDLQYSNRRNQNFFIAVNCTVSSSTCFCASMQTGPSAKTGFDISITEITLKKDSGEGSAKISYIFRSDSDQGESLLKSLSLEEPTASLLEAEAAAIEDNTQSMKPTLAPQAAALLKQNVSSQKWQQIKSRCLSCGNCTMVCPTCFCSTVEDHIDLSGTEATRTRRWDSCFNSEFSYIHGGEIRTKTASRYRQWLTHKFSTWVDQFGISGCVGCGRCITWCPVGIDVREEIEKL